MNRLFHSIARTVGIVLAVASCAGDSPTSPEHSLEGVWNLVSISNEGELFAASGTWTFNSDGTYIVSGTVATGLGEATSLMATGTFVQKNLEVVLTASGVSGTWSIMFEGDRVRLSIFRPPPINAIESINLERPAQS